MTDFRWKNWSGSLSFTPGKIVTPESEEEVVALVKTAQRENRKIRVVGAGHSSSPLVKTKDILLSLKHFQGAEEPDTDSHRLTILGGMTVKDAGKEAFRYGLAMHNTGDVDVQTIAGAIGTGTHGTGVKLKNLSSMLVGVRMVTGTGEILETTSDNDKELFRALQLAMGTCGIFLKMRLQLEKTYHLHRKEWCVPIEKCLENFNDLKKNRNFDFYWYPRSDLAKIRVMNKVEQEVPEIFYGSLEMEKKGPSHEILPRSRPLKFDEMEYVLPADKALDCFLEVRELIKKYWRKRVAWRVLVRTIKSDEAYISPMAGRESVTISLHHNAGLRFWDYFQGIEPIFVKYGGRPHWGKKHTLKADKLRDLYPHWDKFHDIRKQLDPTAVFLTPYMEKLLITK
ncbi:oxidoreductase [Salegentibacter salinarum]|uniref:Oxidoreductase n=1 Tax=Salegentibacter salinarum TaxID=447422 RepID=A0A2N0TNC9_9FLAO|nr:D-arabinono-1,4-lactone oxidase [Salegentibacter salinarum]PKD16226.1 oxidoreductase [Salegentibacter salinarum]SKB67733.1 FAD/FMN-containing dehydrogenase [Salegentibacter salinarum]